MDEDLTPIFDEAAKMLTDPDTTPERKSVATLALAFQHNEHLIAKARAAEAQAATARMERDRVLKLLDAIPHLSSAVNLLAGGR